VVTGGLQTERIAPPEDTPNPNQHSDGQLDSIAGAESRYANAWYYLFSSVPQIFAAAFALLFAFALYRLQHLEQSIAGIGKEIEDFFDRIRQTDRYAADCRALAARSDWQTYLQHIAVLLATDEVVEAAKAEKEESRMLAFARERVAEMQQLLSLVRDFWHRFWWCLVLTSTLIVGTTTLIPLGYWACGWLLAIAWVLACVCTALTLYMYSRLASVLLPFESQRLRRC